MQINCIKLVFIVDDGGMTGRTHHQREEKKKREKGKYAQFRGRLTTGLAYTLNIMHTAE